MNWIQALPQHYTFTLYDYSSGSQGAALASVNVSVPAPTAHTGTISASPNPCTVTTPGGTCTLTLTWSTSGATAAQVWVTDNTGVTQYLFTGLNGSQSLNWIQALPQHYTFNLYDYSSGSQGALLASVSVSVPAPTAHTGTISASPNPCTVTTPGGTCTLTLNWSTSGATAAQVWVTDNTGVTQFLFSGLSGSQSLNWIQALPQHYTFTLYDYSSGSQGASLGSVNVSVPAPSSHTGTMSASPNPCTVTTPGGTCTLSLTWSTSGATAAQVWVTDNTGVTQYLFTGLNGSQSLNWIQALPQHYTFNLYDYSSGSQGALLASVNVSVPAPTSRTGTISASPNPCTVTTPGGTCTLTLTWSTSGATAAQVWVTDNTGVTQYLFTGLNGSQSLNWIQALPQHYTFNLYDYSSGSQGALLASVSVSVPAPSSHTGTISANPNPCTVTTPGGTCTLTLTWSTSGATAAQVWVTDNTGVTQYLFTGLNGSQSLNWIQALPQHYTFNLYDYSSGSQGSVLASVNVSVPAPTGGHTGTISASPNPCTVATPGGTCTLTLNWSTSGATAAQVWVTDNTGVTQFLFSGLNGSQSLNWIQALPQHYTFNLYDYSSGSQGAALSSVNVSVPAPSGSHTGTISASPNPCTVTTPGGTCTLTLSWSTSGATAAQVWVTDNTGVTQFLFTGLSGSQSLNWIQALPQHYTFNLYDYSSGSQGALLSSVNVSVPAPTGGHTGTISASPNPCTVTTQGGTCTLTLSWSTSGATTAQVWVTDNTGVTQFLFSGLSGSQSLNWIQALPQHYTFNLYDYSSGSRGALLSSLNVSVPAPTAHTGTISASPNPCTVTTPGGTCTLTLNWSSSGATAAQVWVTDNTGVTQFLFSGLSGSQSLNWIQALPQHYTFNLYDYSGGTQGALLSSVNVSVPAPTGSHTGTISASPNPCTVTTPGGTCTLTLSWSSSAATAAQVWVTDNTGVTQFLFSGLSGSQSLNWIQALPQRYTFSLYDYSSGSQGALLSSVTVSVPAPTGSHSGTISASPNPCTVATPGGTCTLTLSWSSSGATAAQVWVTDNTGVTQFLFSGLSGSQSLNWIQALPQHYTFNLYDYSSGSQGAAMASVNVSVPGPTGPTSGTLKASPTTCQVTAVGGTCAISLPWTLQNTTSGLITVTDALGNQKVVNPVTGASGTQPIPWLQALPQHYTFYLWDYTGGRQGAQLASVAVSATGPSASSGTPSVSVDPSRNTPGSTFKIYGSALAPGQATVYVQPPGASGNAVGQTTVGSDGTFNFPFTTQASSATGIYTAWAIDSSSKKSSSGTFTLYQPTPASIPTCQSNTTTSGCNGDPINTATGNYTYQHTDLTIVGRGMPFVFTRTYNSQDGTPGPMGAGWTHSYMASFVQNSDSSITIRTPDGQLLIFDPAGGGYVSRFNSVYSTLQSPSSGVFVLTTKNQFSYRFSSGQLTAVSDRNGTTIQLTYSNGILTAITDTVGRQFAVSADPAGRITQLLGPAGLSLQYQYDGAGNLISFKDANGGTFAYTYDGSHEMLTAVDPVGNTFLTNTYDGSGRVSTQADGLGNRWTYAYDANTLITTITDPNGKVSSHLHDSNFELLRATDTFGKNDQYQYDSLGNRISVQDRNGNTTRLSYDPNGNLIAATDAQSNTQAAAYDAQSNPLTRTDALGNQATFAYDSKGNLVTSVDPLGNKTAYAYNSYGQLTSKTDALGRTIQYTYDATGNLTQVLDPLGNKTAYAYDALGRRTSTTDANGFTTNTAYDANSNIVSVTDALGNKTQYAYDGNNNRTKVTDPRGKVTAYAYDGNQKLVTTTDALGNKVSNTYDKLRNLASVSDQRGNTTRYSYDSENRPTGTTDPLGNTTSYAYDAAGNRIQVTDPLSNVTAYGYDSLNRQISVKDALGNQTATWYDAASHVVKKTDAVGTVTTYSYDAAGRQASIVDAAGGQVTFQYDKVGNRTQITDSRGKVTQFAYDGMNRLLTTTDPLGNATKNQYDSVGNLTQTTDGNGNSKAYQYDADRRPIKITYSTGGSVQFAYDVNGNRIKMVDLVGTSTYSYDDLNRLQSYTNPASAALAFTYDAGSNRTAIQFPGSKTVQYTYDADNRISKATDWNSMAASYSYDRAGRISGVTYPNGLTSQYTYNSVGQTLTIQHGTGGTTLYSETTAWLPNGNPASSNISGLAAPGFASESTAYAYNDANELVSSTYGSPVSDKNGNLTVQPGFGGPTVFTYDLSNRATSISGPSVNATMKYFGDGRLAELDSAGAPHRYLVDPIGLGNRILAELDAAGGVQIAYVYGPRDLLSQISGSQTYFYFHNLQRSTVALVDSTGSLKNSYRYDSFGQRLPSSTEQVANPFTFLGGFSVPSTGPYSVMSYRIYDSRLGRFSGLDPVYFKQGAVSPYIYASQSPLGGVDPSGLIASPVSYSTPTSLLGPLPSSTPTPVVTTSNTTALRVQMAQAQADAEVSAAENDAYATAQQQVVDATVNAAQGVVDLFFCTGSLGIDSDACKGVVTSQVDNANFVIQNTVKSTTVKSAANCVTAGSDIVGVVGGLKSNLGGTQLYDAPFNLYGTNQLLSGKSNDVIAGCISGPAQAMGGH